jgi:hypothetical protein
VTATGQARRRPLCRRRPCKDTRATRPWGAPETRTNLPYEGRLVTTGAPARAPRAVLSRPELEAAPGAALAPSECARLAQPRAPKRPISCKRRDDQAQLCGRLRSRRRRVPPAEDQDTRTGRRRHLNEDRALARRALPAGIPCARRDQRAHRASGPIPSVRPPGDAAETESTSPRSAQLGVRAGTTTHRPKCRIWIETESEPRPRTAQTHRG